jgi:hypothetical protein
VPALLLGLGFATSSTAFFAAAWALGAGLLGPWRNSAVAWAVAAAFLLVLFLCDLKLFGLRTAMWRRQTPKWFIYRFGNRRSALFWGLDAGLVVTTFRITSLSWAALALTFVGLLPWWIGLVYAAGFVIPELTFDLILPRRTDPTGATDPEPGWAVDVLNQALPAVRRAGQGVLAAGTLIVSVALWLE